MADEFVRAKLIECGLEIYINKFKEHDITEDVFYCLNKYYIEKITDKIGHQIKLLNLINADKGKETPIPICHLKKEIDSSQSLQDIGSPHYPQEVKSEYYSEEIETPLSLLEPECSLSPSVGLVANDTKKSKSGSEELDPLENSHPSEAITKAFTTDAITVEAILMQVKRANAKLLKTLLTPCYKPNMSDKRALNRIVSNWLCCNTDGYPSSQMKKQLAETLILAFPSLNSGDGKSIDLWYQESDTGKKAGGLIEVRISNWRKGLGNEEKRFVRRCKSEIERDRLILLSATQSSRKRIHGLNNVNNSEIPLGSPEITGCVLKQEIRKINGKLLEELQNEGYVATISDKRAVNRTLADWLCNQRKGNPSPTCKKLLIEVLLETFPSLKAGDGDTIEFWYNELSSGVFASRVKNWNKTIIDDDKIYVRRGTEKESINIDIDKMDKLRVWCMHNSEPLDLVREKMEGSFHLRRIEAISFPISDMFNDWPHLKSEEFIRMDFSLLISKCGGDVDGFMNAFPFEAERIIRYSQEKKNTEAIHPSIINDDTHESTISNSALVLLPLLLPQGITLVCYNEGAKRKYIRPTYSDTIQSFMLFLPDNCVVNMPKPSETCYPFVAVCGPKDDVNTFVVMEDTLIKCSSLLSAVNCLFQMFYVFNLEYPQKAKNFFLFLEKRYFKMPSSATVPSCVIDLNDRLNETV